MLDRVRRVKCDENKPVCKQCTLTGRKCDGYVTPSSRRSTVKWTTPATALSIAMLSHRDDGKRSLELHCLNAFRHKIVASVSDDVSRRVERLILQCLHQESCVRHAAVAFTAHQLQTMSQWPGSSADATFSLQSYGKFIRALQRTLLRPDKLAVEIALVCSLLGICYELVQGDYDGARLHFENSLRVCSSCTGESESLSINACATYLLFFPALVDTDITNAFMRLDVQGSTFVEGWVPRLTLNFPPEEVDFDSLQTAQRHLYSHLSKLWAFLRAPTTHEFRYLDVKDRPSSLINQTRQLTVQSQRWKRLFHTLLGSTDYQDMESQIHSNLLVVHHTTAEILLQTALCPDELCYDEYDDLFKSIVTLSTSVVRCRVVNSIPPPFSLGLGIIQPLFFTATRCRERSIRAEAIELLAEAKGTEGLWNGAAMAKIALTVKQLEESDLDEDLLGFCRVPEFKRVHSTGTDIKPRKRCSEVCCSLRPRGPKDTFDDRFFHVSW